MRLKLYQVDAFTDHVFGGNPAAVVPLVRWLDDELMQAIAAENNLSETVFLVPEDGGYALRWFTPTVEVPLCGHATLASAHVLFRHLGLGGDVVAFTSKSGPLRVLRQEPRLVLDFPAMPPERRELDAAVVEALGALPRELWATDKLLAVFDSELSVRALAPDFARLAALDAAGVIATAPGAEVDFVSRYFAPGAGIDEDPVTGSAHCVLVPYWAERLGRTTLHARQVSRRGGELWCEQAGGRVLIAGHAVTYMEAEITI